MSADRKKEINDQINSLRKELNELEKVEKDRYQNEEREKYEKNIKGKSFYKEGNDFIYLIKPRDLGKNFEFHAYCSVPCDVFAIHMDSKNSERLFSNEFKDNRLDSLTNVMDETKFVELKNKILSLISERLDKLI
jgi:hypothetical protein